MRRAKSGIGFFARVRPMRSPGFRRQRRATNTWQGGKVTLPTFSYADSRMGLHSPSHTANGPPKWQGDSGEPTAYLCEPRQRKQKGGVSSLRGRRPAWIRVCLLEHLLQFIFEPIDLHI